MLAGSIISIRKEHRMTATILEKSTGEPTLLGEALELLEQAQVDRRLAGIKGNCSYYDETQKFIERVNIEAGKWTPRS